MGLRTLSALIFLLTPVLIFGSGDLKASAPNSAPNIDLELSSKIEEFLRIYSDLKVGMTRKDLRANFEKQGGFQSGTIYTYYYYKCMYIKVDFEFEQSTVNTPDDKIINISRPYLEYAVVD